MGFTSGNDINILQATDSGVVGAGLGDDIYVLSADQMADGQEINISDADGTNALRLVGGLTITSSKVASDTIQLTLSNGAIVNILGASSFTYEVGGTGLATSPVVQDFTTFVTNSMGLAAVPAAGEVVDGPADLGVNEDGTTTEGGGSTPATFTFAASADEINEGEDNTFTVTASAPVEQDTEVTFQLALGTAQLDDFSAGSFNAIKVTIPAGETTATYAYTALGDDGTELSETYSVSASVGGTVVGTAEVTILDGGAGAGQTFTLTANVDNIEGTGGNDTIIAGPGSAGGIHTLGASDVIEGNDGKDKLILTSEAAAIGETLVPRMSGVEQIFAQAVGAGATTINMINATEVEELWNDNSTNDIVVTNLQEKAAIGVIGGDGLNDYNVAAATTAARTGDLAIVLDNADINNLIVNATGLAGAAGYTSTTINASSGDNEIFTLDLGATLATVNVTGNGALAVATNLAATVRTIDASANKGGVNLSIANNTGNVTFTGGEGADRIDFGTTLNLNDKVDGGAGRDILAVNSQVEIITGLQVSNVEILELNTLNGTLDASRIAGVDEVRVAATLANVSGTAVVNGLTSNSTFVTNDSGDVRLNITNAQVANTNDTLNLKTGIAGIGGWVDVMAAGVENIVYTQNNDADAGDTTNLFFYDTDLVVDMSSLSVTNNAGNLVIAQNLVNTIKTVNASAAKGSVALSIAGGNATNGVAITGGEGDDELFGGDGKDIIVGGAGDDHISGDGFFTVPGTGGAAIAQQTTVTIANEEAGDEFTVSIDGVDYTVTSTGAGTATGLLATAIGTSGGAIASSTATSATVLTLDGLVDGTAFSVTTATQNAAAGPEVSIVTFANEAYDAGDVASVTINGATYSYMVLADDDGVAEINDGLAAAINGGTQMTAAVVGNTLELTGVTTTDYTVTAALVDGGAAIIETPSVLTITPTDFEGTENIAVTLGDVTYSVVFDTNLATSLGNFKTAHEVAINAATGGTLAATPGTLTVTNAVGTGLTITSGSGAILGGDGGTVTVGYVAGNAARALIDNTDPAIADNLPIAAGADTQTAVVADVVTGQASTDQYLTSPANADTLTGGAGNDTFWFLSGSNGWDGTSFTTMDTITDLNLGGATAILGADTIVLNSSVFNAFANTDLINAGTPLAMAGPNLGAAVQALFNAGGALNGSVNDIGLFTYSGDTYLIATDNVAGLNANDVLIKVTGVTGTLDLTDIALA